MKRIMFLVLLVLSTINYQPSTAFAQPTDNLNSVIAYPNPVRTSIGNDKVTFDNLTNNVNIKIFKINGAVVREIDATDTNGTVTWDLTNDSGEKLASGIYIYLISNELGQKTKSKIAIIR